MQDDVFKLIYSNLVSCNIASTYLKHVDVYCMQFITVSSVHLQAYSSYTIINIFRKITNVAITTLVFRHNAPQNWEFITKVQQGPITMSKVDMKSSLSICT